MVERLHVDLAFQAEDPGSIPGAGSHISYSSFHCIYPSYPSSSVGWGRKMAIPVIGALLRARNRTRVAVVEFHVSLSHLSFIYAGYMCEYNDMKSLYSAERSYNSNSSSYNHIQIKQILFYEEIHRTNELILTWF